VPIVIIMEVYCDCNKQGLLEECYPSLRINIWCYPTSMVLTISSVGYLVNVLVYCC
jgi:hypothetical protein